MTPGDNEDICVSKLLHFVQGVELLNDELNDCAKD
jgi:hypothetical protein